MKGPDFCYRARGVQGYSLLAEVEEQVGWCRVINPWSTTGGALGIMP